MLLIEINSPDTRSIIPGKLFEYMVSGRPILAMGPNGSDFATMVKSTNTGVFYEYHEKAALKTTLLDWYRNYQKGQLVAHAVGLQQYSRKNLTQQLVRVIEQV